MIEVYFFRKIITVAKARQMRNDPARNEGPAKGLMNVIILNPLSKKPIDPIKHRADPISEIKSKILAFDLDNLVLLPGIFFSFLLVC